MEKTEKQSTNLSKLTPGPGSTFTHVLNAIGNATMIALLPFGLISMFQARHNNPQLFRNTMLVSTAAVAIGAIWGLHEAKHIKKYRTALTDEMGDMRQRIGTLEADRDHWRDKIMAQKTEKEKSPEAAVHQF